MGMSIQGAGYAGQSTSINYIQQQQMKSQMDTLMSSVQTTTPAQPVSKPIGNLGNNIDTMA